MRLLPLADQVVVVAGASSGIGRAACRRLARDGATVVALARGEAALASLVSEITDAGGAAHAIVCDVADETAVQHAAAEVEPRYGRIDTWVHNAGVLLVGDFDRTSPDEYRRVLEINFLGQVIGALAAIPALERAGGGAFISITSVEGVAALPLHSAYAASKHAVEGFLDGMRRELVGARVPVSVTAIRPAVIDTPIYRVARNRLGAAARGPRPFYDPAVVAECIAFAATHPVRTLHAGGAARLITALQAAVPAVVDVAFGRWLPAFMTTDAPPPHPDGNLDRSLATGRTRGGLPRPGRRFSAYTWLELRPWARWTLGGVALAAVAAGLALRRRRG